MNKLLSLPLFTLLVTLFFTSCEERARVVEQGELVKCPILEKYKTGSKNPKGPKENYYFKVHVGVDNSQHRVQVDQVTWKRSNVGDLVPGYYLDGVFVEKRVQYEF